MQEMVKYFGINFYFHSIDSNNRFNRLKPLVIENNNNCNPLTQRTETTKGLNTKSELKVRFDDTIDRNRDFGTKSETNYKNRRNVELQSILKSDERQTNRKWSDSCLQTSARPLDQTLTQRLTVESTHPKNFSTHLTPDLDIIIKNHLKFKRLKAIECKPKLNTRSETSVESRHQNTSNSPFSESKDIKPMNENESQMFPKLGQLFNQLDVKPMSSEFETTEHNPNQSRTQRPFNPKTFSFNPNKYQMIPTIDGIKAKESTDNVINSSSQMSKILSQPKPCFDFFHKYSHSCNSRFETTNTQSLRTETDLNFHKINVFNEPKEVLNPIICSQNSIQFPIKTTPNVQNFSANNNSKQLDSNSYLSQTSGNKYETNENKLKSNKRKFDYSTEALDNFVNSRKDKRSYSTYRNDSTRNPFNHYINQPMDWRQKYFFEPKMETNFREKSKYFVQNRDKGLQNPSKGRNQNIIDMFKNQTISFAPKVFNKSKEFNFTQNEE